MRTPSVNRVTTSALGAQEVLRDGPNVNELLFSAGVRAPEPPCRHAADGIVSRAQAPSASAAKWVAGPTA